MLLMTHTPDTQVRVFFVMFIIFFLSRETKAPLKKCVFFVELKIPL